MIFLEFHGIDQRNLQHLANMESYVAMQRALPPITKERLREVNLACSILQKLQQTPSPSLLDLEVKLAGASGLATASAGLNVAEAVPAVPAGPAQTGPL